MAISPKAHCEICGRRLSVRNLKRYPWPDADGSDGAVYNCVNREACEAAVAREEGRSKRTREANAECGERS